MNSIDPDQDSGEKERYMHLALHEICKNSYGIVKN